MKKLLAVLIMLSLVSLMVVACGGSSGGSGGSGGGSTDVHLGATNFVQSSVTISKGGNLNVIDDTGNVHIITNGMWVNDTPKPGAESGAPTVQQQFNGNDSHTVGPFNTAGTFHLYCTIHSGMNLTVTVQ